MSEHDEQVLVIGFRDRLKAIYPELALLFAIPNGAALSSKAQAQKLKSEGLTTGVPDLFLAIPANGWSGLFIEMKFGKNKPSDEQNEFMQRLADQGYRVVVCWSGQVAVEQICNYLGIEKPAWV